jgi:hypothetical protein
MSINRELSGSANASPLWQQAVRAQLQFCANEVDHYLTAALKMGAPLEGLLPHQWGSMDSFDDMRTVLAFTAALFSDALDPPADVPARLRELIRDHSVFGVADEVQELAFKGWTPEQIDGFMAA